MHANDSWHTVIHSKFLLIGPELVSWSVLGCRAHSTHFCSLVATWSCRDWVRPLPAWKWLALTLSLDSGVTTPHRPGLCLKTREVPNHTHWTRYRADPAPLAASNCGGPERAFSRTLQSLSPLKSWASVIIHSYYSWLPARSSVVALDYKKWGVVLYAWKVSTAANSGGHAKPFAVNAIRRTEHT